ncbi:MAG: DNA translocase FtsK [Candidatus Latescibacterota bacterium]|nr:DNA translocase FtsK [Candidatus Latescibacterota bacterium]
MFGELQRLMNQDRVLPVLGILALGVGLFFLVSYSSYSDLDYPNSSRSADLVENWGGRVGASLSYSSFDYLGWGAYSIPLLFLFWGWSMLIKASGSGVLWRSIGLFSMTIFFCIGSGLPNFSSNLAHTIGGGFGYFLSHEFFIPYLGRLGSSVLLMALFLATLIAVTDLNLRWLMELLIGVGRKTGKLLVALWLIPVRGVEAWRLRRASKKAKHKIPIDDEDFGEDILAEKLEINEAADIPIAVSNNDSLQDGSNIADDLITLETEVNAGKKDSEPLRIDVSSHQDETTEPSVSTKRKKSRGRYKVPKMGLLDEVPENAGNIDRELLLQNARRLEQALDNFDVAGKVVEVSPGPVVTRYEVEPAAGVKVNRIVTLSDDLARIMSAKKIRIQAPVPGKSVVGVEIANHDRETVYLREILESKEFRRAESKLTMALGKTIAGEPYAADMAKMPHLLVAGATGAGKSVCINCLICSILFKATPDQVRFLMVDPKVVELTMYNDIPHLLVPVITEPKKASDALKWAVAEMEARYQKLAKLGVRNLADYNIKLERINVETQDDGVEQEKAMPYIVIVIDEFADLMLTAPADVETSLMGLAQKSRAVGIHIILATQRPSVNVITGVIKANFPSRIAFQVASKTDSRTILDMNGAESLLGQGDMLFLPGGQGEAIRIHGAFLSGEETERMVEDIKNSGYQSEEVGVFSNNSGFGTGEESQDELFNEAMKIVVEAQQASTSYLQRRMKVGYSRAARLMDELEHAGVVGPADGAKPRQIYVEDISEMLGGQA